MPSVTVMLQQNPEGGWRFAYSSPDPGVVTVVDGTTHINVPVGAHEVTLTLDGSAINETAVFIEHPLVWLNEAGEPQLIPSGVVARLDDDTHLVLTVQNDNPGPNPVGFTF